MFECSLSAADVGAALANATNTSPTAFSVSGETACTPAGDKSATITVDPTLAARGRQGVAGPPVDIAAEIDQLPQDALERMGIVDVSAAASPEEGAIVGAAAESRNWIIYSLVALAALCCLLIAAALCWRRRKKRLRKERAARGGGKTLGELAAEDDDPPRSSGGGGFGFGLPSLGGFARGLGIGNNKDKFSAFAPSKHNRRFDALAEMDDVAQLLYLRPEEANGDPLASPLLRPPTATTVPVALTSSRIGPAYEGDDNSLELRLRREAAL